MYNEVGDLRQRRCDWIRNLPHSSHTYGAFEAVKVREEDRRTQHSQSLFLSARSQMHVTPHKASAVLGHVNKVLRTLAQL